MAKRLIAGSVLGVLKRAWAQIALALFVGSVLVYVSPERGYLRLLGHIGIGLIVAAIVTIFWQLKELTEFFLSLARTTLIQDDYLRKLNPPALRKVRSGAAAAIIGAFEDRNPDYDWESLERWADDVLFSRCLPGGTKPLSGVYREGYRETITVEFTDLRAVLAESNLPEDSVPPEALGSQVLRQSTITTYSAIAPRVSEEYKDYPVQFYGKSSDMPYLPVESRIRFYIGKSEADSVPVVAHGKDITRGGVELDASYPVPFENGKAVVWMKTVEYDLPQRETFVVGTMSDTTKGLRVHLTFRSSKRMVVEGDVIGFGRKPEILYPDNGIDLEYKGWLLEDQGYIIWWWEA